MADLGIKVTIVTRAESGGQRIGAFDLIRIPRRAGLTEDLSWAFSVRRAVAAVSPDVVLAAEWRHPALACTFGARTWAVVTCLAGSLAQLRRLGREHRRDRQVLRVATRLLGERLQTTRADAIIAPSEAVLDWASRLWPISANPTRVIPNCVDLKLLQKNAPAARPAGYPIEGRSVVFVGRLDTQKGVDVLVEAMLGVWNRVPDARVVLIGWGPRSTMEEIRHRVRASAGRLYILGPRPHDEVCAALARAAVVVAPSRWEAFGLSALEAIALGRPVVATSGSGFESFLESERNALLVPPGDASGLAAAIIRLLRDKGLAQRLGDGGRADAHAYDSPLIARRYLAFFREILALRDSA
ncbi:MAG: glycosyltransferase family 4 protein [Actinobacteria bacterium]|nr:MAG: glycosyltransferase family 4 protein [Actinomycetota bacterium]